MKRKVNAKRDFGEVGERGGGGGGKKKIRVGGSYLEEVSENKPGCRTRK